MNSNNKFLSLLGFISLSLLISLSESKPYSPHFSEVEIDDIDACILGCDTCYKGQTLVQCANSCIESDGVIGPAWKHVCPFFRYSGSGHRFPSTLQAADEIKRNSK